MAAPGSRRVLIVDDNEELAENIAEILAMDGHSVRVARSGEQALLMVRSRDLDLVITDYRLPGITGAELLEALRDRGETMSAIVISAYNDDQTMNHASRVGASFISKPIDVALLSRVVRNGVS